MDRFISPNHIGGGMNRGGGSPNGQAATGNNTLMSLSLCNSAVSPYHSVPCKHMSTWLIGFFCWFSLTQSELSLLHRDFKRQLPNQIQVPTLLALKIHIMMHYTLMNIELHSFYVFLYLWSLTLTVVVWLLHCCLGARGGWIFFWVTIHSGQKQLVRLFVLFLNFWKLY